MNKESALDESDLISGKHGDGTNESNIYDPTHLVSPSAHGRLDTIQKGFSFTEGPPLTNGEMYFLLTNPMIKFIDGTPSVVV